MGGSHLGGVLVGVATVIFAVEALIMGLMHLALPHLPGWSVAITDAAVLTLVSCAILYLWIIKPLDRNLTVMVDALHNARAEAEKLSQIDPLTGVLNRRAFFERFEREWDRSNRNGMFLSCIMLDLDLFKQVNDTHGHLAGDAILKMVAELLQTDCRLNDDVCRYGGEEFCILLPESEQDEAAAFAVRMCGIIEQTPTCHGNKVIHVTASFGVAQRKERMSSVEELVDAADQALLRAKQSGRNRVRTADEEWELQLAGSV